MISAFFKKNPILSWVLVAVAAAVAVEGGYLVYQGRISRQATEDTASAQAPLAAPGQGENTDAQTADSKTAEQEQASVAVLMLPRFDLLRVEPDGSAVVAGAAPGAKTIELISNGIVIATIGVAENGDFVFALDNPFSPGAYELSLRAVAEDGTTVMSKETGIINIPESGGELLAMVDSEGQAPRIMQTPQSAATPAPAAENAPATQPVPETKEPESATALAPAEPAAEATPEVAAPAQPETMETARVETLAPATEAKAGTAATAGSVLVQAVDVEGDRLFIAGSGVPGRNVNIYIDGDYLGTAAVGTGRSFLLETQKPLANGEYEIRADMLGTDGVTVDQRAAVRLVHDTGEMAGTETAAAPAEPAGDNAATQTQTTHQGAVIRETGTEGTTVVARSETPTQKGSENVPSEKQAAASPQSETPPAQSGTGAESGTPVTAAAETGQNSAAAVDNKPVEAEILPILRTGDSVIIRKGDNLWRISRRMLGHGLHYTVIYEANRQQIRNPHLIYPGQIFDVPASVPGTGSG
jgi:nucleoid-associated protein YgaU